jgi:hypothetical protein
VILTRDIRRAGLAEGDLLAGGILQLDGAVLEDVAQPGALLLAAATQKAAGLAVRAAVFGQPGQRLKQRADKPFAQSDRGPLFELAQIQVQPDDRKMGVETGSLVVSRR